MLDFKTGKLYHSVLPLTAWKSFPTEDIVLQDQSKTMRDIEAAMVPIEVGDILIYIEGLGSGELERFLFKDTLVWIDANHCEHLRPGKYTPPEIKEEQ